MTKHTNKERLAIKYLVLLAGLVVVLSNDSRITASVTPDRNPADEFELRASRDLRRLPGRPLLYQDACRATSARIETEVPGPWNSPLENDVFVPRSPEAMPGAYEYQPDAAKNVSTASTAKGVLSHVSAHTISYSLPMPGVGSDDALKSRPACASYGILPPLERRGWFIALIGILAGSATITFERYRAARIKELDAALTASAELTQQLTTQQMELGKVTRILALDYAATRALAESASAREAALGVLQTICITTRWDLGTIRDVDPQSKTANCVGVWQNSMTDLREFDTSVDGEPILPDIGLWESVVAGGQPRWVTDILDSGDLPRSTPAGKGSPRSAFGFPIPVGSQIVGVLELYSFDIRQPDQDLIQIMSSVGSRIGQLLQRRRAEEALNRIKEDRLAELQCVRRRIATDLHDDVGSSLTKIALLSEALRENVSEKNEAASERLTAITSVTNELVETMSDIVWAINPQKDSLIDLSQRMRRFASDIFTTSQIAFRFVAPSHVQDTQLGASVRREVFLIFKEAVNNIVKHSKCTEVNLNLAVEVGWLTLSVSDNGKGFNPALVKADTGYLSSQRRGGNGLASMRRRAREMGGQFDIETGIGMGATMYLRMPIGRGSDSNSAAIHSGGDTRSS